MQMIRIGMSRAFQHLRHDHTGKAAVFVEYGKEVHAGMEKLTQQSVQRLGFLHEMQGPHDVGKAGLAAVAFTGAAGQRAPLHQPDQILVVVAENGNAAEVPDLGVVIGFVHGQAPRQGENNGARGHDVVDALLIQRKHVADKAFFVVLNAPGLAGKAGDGADIVFGNLRALGLRRDGAGQQAQQPDQGREQAHGPLQRHGKGHHDGRAVGDAQRLGDNFAHHENDAGKGRGKDAHVLAAENSHEGRARHGGTGGIGHRVHGKNGGNGFVDVGAEPVENFPRPPSALPGAFDGGPRHGVQRRFRQGAGEGGQYGDADGQSQSQHATILR